ncbi:MAG: hypothetical protein Q8Q89_03965 [bacterium]|nr:hypothetical protein [bacterium]
MPCEYSVVKIVNRIRKKNANKKKVAQSKKGTLVKSLVALGFEVSLQTIDPEKTFILGSSNRGKIEIVFNEKDGKFVTHFDGVETHDKEHEILDALVDTLKKSGLSISVDHYHERPKLPEFEAANLIKSGRIKT